MFDKIQSTYFKRVTTGVLALFMTASSGFSYAVPVYAEEVTTAAAKRKKEEEFSSTESSTLQLNENSTKEEVKNNQDTGNDDVKVTTNGSSEDQPEVTYEKPDTKEPGRKLSSEEAQKDLKKIIENKKYSYEDILQRIFEIDDFSFYSSLTSDDIKFLMSGKTEEKYEILEILKLKSVNYYDYNSLSPKKFYLSLFSYFKLIDQCDEELSKDMKEQIQDQVLKDINQFYIKEKSLYYKNINDFYVNDMQDFENVSKEDGAKYVDAISTYIYTKSDERDKNVIRKALDLEEVDEETDEKELEDWATNNKDGPFTIKDHLDSLKGTEESYNQGGDYGYSTNNYFYVTIHDKGGNDTNATINITGRSSKYGNKDKKLYQHMLKSQTTWNCSMTINGANNHNLSLTHNTVTTKQDKFKGTDGQFAWFVMNFKISYTRHSYYYNKGCSYDKNDADIRFNTKNYTLYNTGDDGNSIERGYTSYDKPVTANIQINTGHTGTRTFNHYRYRGGRVTINYTRETHTIRYDANGGYGAPGNQTKTMGVDLWLSSTTPSRSQYVFKGWNTQANGSGTSYSPGQQFYPDADTTLYAQWEKEKYTATVKLNGGSYNGSTKDFTISKYPGEEISIGAPTRSKHNFTGYKLTMDNNDGDAPTSVTQSASGFKGIMQMGNFTLNAQWTPWKHTVRYDANAKNDTSVKGIPASQSKTANVDIKLSSDVPTRNGYTFLGWNTQADGNGTAYATGATYTHDQDGGTVTLYAKWTPWKHVLHYNKNVPTSSTSQTVSNMPVDQTKTFGQLMTISNLVPTRKGYTFAGWYTQSNGTGTKYDPGSNYAADQNGGTVNLYAKWTAWKHTVTYDKNVPANSKKTDVKNMPGNQTKIYDQNLTLQSNVPTRIGYTFAKWTTNKDGTGTAYQPGSQYSYNRDSDDGTVTLYAVWTPWKYKVQYDKNVSADSSSQTVSNMPTDQTKTEEVVLTLSSNKPNRNGYIFNGWQAQINGKAVDYQPGAKLSYDVDDKDGSTIILKAQWTPWKHTVHYDANGGDQSSVPNDQKKTYEQNMNVATKVPTRNEYKFLGWKAYHEYNDKSGNKHSELIGNYQPGASYNYDIDETGQYAADNGEYNKCGTVTMKAQWVQLYTVKYDGNQPAIKGVTVTGSVANQTQGQDESVNLRTNNFKNDSGVYKDWSVGKDAYKYAVKSGIFRKYIHPEGFKTNHSTMQNELYDYTEGIARQ